MLLADNNIWGTIKPTNLPESITGDPVAGLGKILSLLLKITLRTSGIVLLIYLLWGGFDYITAGGDKEKLENARRKIYHAIIGLLIIFSTLAIFGVITGNILGIIKITPQGWQLNIPTIGD